jgi:flagellin
MPTVINTNLASLFAQNSLSNAQNNLAQSVQRLSSGLRINSAKDDTAGLSISQNMQGQINGTNQSIRNLSDATNLLQVADSSLATVQDMILRMKQLAVQGYDGSLSISQKLNIVQELKDLNAEINATAQRTAFNGINLLTSGSSIDLVNSDLKAGVALSNTAVSVNRSTQTLGSVNELGYYAVGGSAGTTGLNDAANTKVGGGGTVSSFNINLDSAKSKFAPGTYTLVNNGANLTLTGTYKGLTQSQTITLANITGNAIGGADLPVNTVANFSDFGIELNINSTIGAGVSYTGTQLAANITARGSQITVNGKGAEISDVRLSGVAPGTYTMSFENTGTVGSLSLPATRTGFAGTGGAGGTLNVALTGGSGTGATANVTYDTTGKITDIAVQKVGTGYKAGDILGSAALGASVATSRVTFADIAATQTIIIGGLTFTAGANGATAAQLAYAFSNITANDAAATINTANGLSASTGGTFTAGTAAAGINTGNVQGTSNNSLIFTGGTTPVDSGNGADPTVVTLAANAGGALAALSGIAVSTLATESVSTNQLKMTGTINGATTTESVTLSAGVANAKQLVEFKSFGIQFDVSSYQTQTAKDIGYALATLNTGSNSSTYGTTGQLLPGQVVVARGNNSELKFQSGATTEAFIQIDTLNIQTGTNGAAAGTATEMMNLGTRVTSSDAGNLGTLGVNNTIDQWQTAFKNMADATDQALEYVSTQRATYGSQMNRIAYTSTNLQAQSTNLQNSRSSIIDTDFAAETARLTKGQIMQQAATAMLAQANQMPNVILSLLK